ncbi:MAG: DUF2695 domain-containing protein [Candidatus Yanofskybacteria bacterium]|nr:DUF2695 domain-containing protein [Candidatus Yanofskybacteria bacterium]
MALNEVMTPENPRWNEFADILAEAINAQDEPGVSDCKHDFSSTRKILTEMGNIDIEASINVFMENGGYCDCEIILNVDPGPEDEDFEEEEEI